MYDMNRPSVSTLLTPQEADEFHRSLGRVMDLLIRFQKRLTPRELVVLKIGLRASHIEESLMVGDQARAKAHLEALVRMAREAI